MVLSAVSTSSSYAPAVREAITFALSMIFDCSLWSNSKIKDKKSPKSTCWVFSAIPGIVGAMNVVKELAEFGEKYSERDSWMESSRCVSRGSLMKPQVMMDPSAELRSSVGVHAFAARQRSKVFSNSSSISKNDFAFVRLWFYDR